MLPFNFENAFLHFKRTGAPRGFVWKYVLAYLGLTILTLVVTFAVLGSFYMEMFETAMSGDSAAFEAAAEPSGEQIVLIYLLILPLSLLLFAVIEASYLRRYMFKDRFKLRLGGTELRLMVVYLIWALFYMLFVGAMSVVVGALAVSGGGGLAVIAGFLASLGYFALAARFAPAAALTVRDGRIRFLDAWRVTKGRFWALFGSMLVWIILAIVAYFVVVMLFGLGFMSMIGTDGMSNPSLGAGVGIVVLVLYTAVLAAGACWIYIFAGPAALAARTDPEWSADADNALVFD